MASAATNALRLHQRIPQLSLSGPGFSQQKTESRFYQNFVPNFVSWLKNATLAQTLQNILAEDSGHYLAYSLMFMSGRQQ